MNSEQERSASTAPSQPLDGEIVGLEDERVRVRLETGVIGFLAGIAQVEIQSTFKLGQQGTFRVERLDEKGETLLSLVSTQASEVPRSFEHEVNRLQNALNNHHATPITHDEVIPTMDEQRIQQWLNRVESSLGKLRKNRAKRLAEEFYSGS